mgnify:CR=1 FL=1
MNINILITKLLSDLLLIFSERGLYPVVGVMTESFNCNATASGGCIDDRGSCNKRISRA